MIKQKMIKQIKFSLDNIIIAISERKCLICGKDLDSDLGRRWKLPLCKQHRSKYLLGEMEEYK